MFVLCLYQTSLRLISIASTSSLLQKCQVTVTKQLLSIIGWRERLTCSCP